MLFFPLFCVSRNLGIAMLTHVYSWHWASEFCVGPGSYRPYVSCISTSWTCKAFTDALIFGQGTRGLAAGTLLNGRIMGTSSVGNPVINKQHNVTANSFSLVILWCMMRNCSSVFRIQSFFTDFFFFISKGSKWLSQIFFKTRLYYGMTFLEWGAGWLLGGEACSTVTIM